MKLNGWMFATAALLGTSSAGFAADTRRDFDREIALLNQRHDDDKKALQRRCDRQVDQLRERFRRENRPLNHVFDDEKRAIRDRCEADEKALNRNYEAKKKAIHADEDASRRGDKGSIRRVESTTSGDNLPPRLERHEEKHNGKLPPGLQKQLDQKGQLPPGLEKR
jgi:hypothetical protein